ncbi:flagellar regulator YcgR PilZN domain-containing protein [Halopseudomonas pachastrellae]|nr:flagellar regulator YcgR PilZN domain-containing protein [Halopseudomonas pachastrellae]
MSNLFSQEADPQPPREIRAQVEIMALLKTLMQSRDPLTITFADRNQKFQSFIVKLDTDQAELWIDEMIPREGDKYASQGEPFRIDAWHEGIHMRWHCPAPPRFNWKMPRPTPPAYLKRCTTTRSEAPFGQASDALPISPSNWRTRSASDASPPI